MANTVCTGNYRYGSCYISPNGAVEHLSSGISREENEVKLNEHGKYVSIIGGYKSLYALHEDGYVENSAENNGTDKDWENIIQISPMLNCTSVALKSDGTMTYGKTTYKNEINGYTFSDGWLETIKNWENITSFNCFVNGFDGLCTSAIILGVKDSGGLCGVSFSSEFDELNNCYINVADSASLDKILSNFSDVKKVNCYSCYPKIVITAVTKHNTIQIYDNEFYELPAENTIDMIPYFKYHGLDSTTMFYKITDTADVIDNYGKIILKDILKIDNDIAISRNGTIYLLKEVNEKQTEKSIVYDEWIERMK